MSSVPSWPRLAGLSGLAVYLLMASEWLFFATKPSFLSPLPWGERLRLLLTAPLAGALLLLLFVATLTWVASRLAAPWRRIIVLIAAVPAALVLSTWCFLLVENFSHTLFGYGAQGAGWLGRIVYLLALAGLVTLWLRWLLRFAGAGSGRLWLGALGMCLALSMVAMLSQQDTSSGNTSAGGDSGQAYNVVLLGTDGLNAEDMQLYGEGSFATPELVKLAAESLLAENAYVNSAHTGASIASMLSGKLPTTTRLIYPPDILRGRDAYEHLPGLLRGLGYKNLDVSVRHYADAFDLNLRRGFLEANGRRQRDSPALMLSPSWLPADDGAVYFVEQVGNRLTDRLAALVGRGQTRAFEEVQGRSEGRGDRLRLRELYRFVEQEGEPFFAHLHLMGTHGKRYNADRVAKFDRFVGQVVSFLKERDLWERTVLVVHTDHGHSYSVHRRVPLLIRFPGGQHAGRLQHNVQNLDIAPTVLHSLGLEIPSWMQGRSLLEGEGEATRPLFSTAVRPGSTGRTEGGGREILEEHRIQPPFYSLGVLSVAVCQRVYRLRLAEDELRVLASPGHTSPCPPQQLPSRQEARLLLLKHLQEQGYDVADRLES